jgi:hypothetical protein
LQEEKRMKHHMLTVSSGGVFAGALLNAVGFIKIAERSL